MNGAILDAETLGEDVDLGPLRRIVADWRIHGATEPHEVVARVASAQILVTNKVALGAEALEAATDLRLVCVAATGTNNVDLETAQACGINVCNVRGYSTPSVVQHTLGLLLMLVTRVPDYHAAVRAGRWQHSRHFCLLKFPVHELAGLELAIIGYGELGRGVARVAEALGMTVTLAERKGHAPRPGRASFDDALGRADVVSLHCPLTEETRGLIGERELSGMKRGAIVLNTARGGLIDETALAHALRSGRLGGAGLDVLSEEPPPPDHPLLADDIPNLIVTPHVAWASRQSRQRLVDEIAANISAFLAGEARNRVV